MAAGGGGEKEEGGGNPGGQVVETVGLQSGQVCHCQLNPSLAAYKDELVGQLVLSSNDCCMRFGHDFTVATSMHADCDGPCTLLPSNKQSEA